MGIFKYGQREVNYLKQQDSTIGAAIKRIGFVEREVIHDLFTALIYAIVGQQISVKAVATIWGRMLERFGDITPQNVVAATIVEIQQCGMSTRKASYIKGIGESVAQGTLNLSELHDLSDEVVIKRLSSLNGIGIWTAEMLLLNSMERPDVVSWDDIAIRRGMMKLYDLPILTKEEFKKYKKLYSPYGSVASLYLWKIAADC